ncbi:hypothetical protein YASMINEVIRUS_869 [Yasminevirus sp. GU-2018]|uniref:Uncharacterized protein n=1 Tax=Yasminevirus sp. GU-2018 TaxID=2420051 RepID=A0A5K0UBE8_9VIRU|nr:hypothetical protein YASMINEVIRUS_869 [Yasminevirus sp. GU-2018]
MFRGDSLHKTRLVNFQNSASSLQKTRDRHTTELFPRNEYDPHTFVTTQSASLQPTRATQGIGTTYTQSGGAMTYLSNDTVSSKDNNKCTDETGSENSEDDTADLMAGGTRRRTDAFPNTRTMYIVADATDQTLIKYFFARMDMLGISANDRKGVKPHISLMEVQINVANPAHTVLLDATTGRVSSVLERFMIQHYASVSPQMYIESIKGNYEIMGDFIAKVYTSQNPTYITAFRVGFYKFIESYLGKGVRSVTMINNKKFFVYSYKGTPLIAVPEYYHGVGVWKPHLSLVRLDKIQNSNPSLYSAYQEKNDVDVLVNALRGVRGSIDSLNMGQHFDSLRITMKQ